MKCDIDLVYVSPDVVYIRDLDLGNMSVTNDAESVCIFINRNYGNKRIIYRDSSGSWDEIIHDNGKFLNFKFLELIDDEVYGMIPSKQVLE